MSTEMLKVSTEMPAKMPIATRTKTDTKNSAEKRGNNVFGLIAKLVRTISPYDYVSLSQIQEVGIPTELIRKAEQVLFTKYNGNGHPMYQKESIDSSHGILNGSFNSKLNSSLSTRLNSRPLDDICSDEVKNEDFHILGASLINYFLMRTLLKIKNLTLEQRFLVPEEFAEAANIKCEDLYSGNLGIPIRKAEIRGSSHAVISVEDVKKPVISITCQDAEMMSEDRLWDFYHSTLDIAAVEGLFKKYEKYCYSLIKKLGIKKNKHEFKELVAEAKSALHKAIRRYDPSRHAQLVTYAHLVITGELKRYERDVFFRERRGYEFYVKKGKAIDTLVEKKSSGGGSLNSRPTSEEIADAMGINIETYLRQDKALKNNAPVSLSHSQEAIGGSSNYSLHELIEDMSTVDIASKLQKAEFFSDFMAAMDTLRISERQAVYYVLVLGHSQTEAAKILKVSQMHVCRLLSFGKEKLRKRLQAYREN